MFQVMFAIGVYTGLYIDQNYNPPKVQNPKEIIEELIKLIKKD